MKEKMIEEMAKVIRPILEHRVDIGFIPDLDKPIAEELIKQDYRKIPEGAVVLSRGEQEYLENITEKRINQLKEEKEQVAKETAEKFVDLLIDNGERQILLIEDNKGKVIDKAYIIPQSHLSQVAKQFGVEVEE